MVHDSRIFDGYGLVRSLLRSVYERNVGDWVFEDDIDSEGIIIVSGRHSHEYRYVVVAEMPVIRAKLPDTGEILEIEGVYDTDSCKRLYRHAVSLAKSSLDMERTSTVIYFSVASYSDYEYLNSCGYMQRDVVHERSIACVSIDLTVDGYVIKRG